MRVAVLGAMLLCAVFSQTADAKVRNASKSDLQALRAAMEDRLKDADSAKFRNVRIGDEKDGSQVMCGEVNSKNSFGAYAGYTKFIAAYMKGVVFVVGVDDGEKTSASEACASRGL
jgi:hypothetical protein